MRKARRKETLVSDELLELARSLNEIYNQSYALLKPIVDDACKHPQGISQSELDHLFDATLEIANAKGERLFNKLCKKFREIYPDSVEDYIKIEQDLYK